MQIDWFNTLWLVFPYLLVATVAVVLFNYGSKKWRIYTQQQRLKKGKNAEKDAQKMLQKAGFKIVDYQPKFKYQLTQNNEKIEVRITPDFVVSKGKKEFVVEVKSGQVASDIKTASTRRQVLEYAMACNRPMLFVDMENREISEIEFPFHLKSTAKNWSKWLAISLMLLTISIVVLAFILFTLNNGGG